jgi:hypothetical protein
MNRNPQPSQSQNISEVSVNSGVVQQSQAGHDLHQVQSVDLKAQQEITNKVVADKLRSLETAVRSSLITQNEKDELLDYLLPAKREAAKEAGSKELVGQNLNQVNETLKKLNETSEAGKSLWQTGQSVFQAIAPWLGLAAKYIGL